MSYILDALKKSEKERSRGSVPSIQSLHHEVTEPPPKKSYWPYIVVALLLVNIVALGLWAVNNPEFATQDKLDNLNSRSDVEHQQGQQLASTTNKSPGGIGGQQTDSKKTTATLDSPVTNPKKNTIEATPNVVFATEPLDVTYDELKQAKETSAPMVVPGTEDVTEIPVREAKLPVTDEILNIADLPESVKRNLPPISFDGHVYSSESDQRSVMINGQKMREGGEISSDLIIDEITVDGAVFRYQSFRFRLGALQDWSFR